MARWFIQKPDATQPKLEERVDTTRPDSPNGEVGQQTLPNTQLDEIGPLRPSELLKLVREGKVKPETLLRKDDSAWFPASAVGGLFEAAAAPTLIYHCPSCQAQVSKPPCDCPKCGHEIQYLRPLVIQHSLGGDDTIEEDDTARKSMTSWLNKVSNRKKK